MSGHIELARRPASLLLPSMLLLPTPCDLTCKAVEYAIELSREASGGVEPNLLLCSREEHFPAREILIALQETFPAIKWWSRYDFYGTSWCVGNHTAPTFFVGSMDDYQESFSP